MYAWTLTQKLKQEELIKIINNNVTKQSYLKDHKKK